MSRVSAMVRYKKKNGGVRRIPRGLRRVNTGNGIHTFTRSIYLPSVVSVTTANVYGSNEFKLSDLPNSSEFTSLFDQFRINSVKWKLLPRGTSAEAATNNSVGKIFSVLDYDDSDPPTSINDLLQYPNVKCTSTVRDHVRTIRPCFATPAYLSGINPSLSLGFGQRRGFLDCSNTAVPHYSVKWAIQGTAGAQIFDVMLTYSISFKGVR